MKFRVIGYYFDGNLGDSILEIAVKEQLQRIIPDCSFVNNEDDCDMLVLGGGGMYSNYQVEAYDTWAIPINKCLDSGKPVVGYGIGVDLYPEKPRANEWTELLSRIPLLMVRHKVCKTLVPNAITTADPAYLFFNNGPLRIGVNLVNLRDADLDSNIHKMIEDLKELGDVTVLCCWRSHLNYCEKFGCKVVIADDPFSIQSIMSRFNCIIATQYHPCMASLMSNIPTIVIEYSPKQAKLHNFESFIGKVPTSFSVKLPDVKDMLVDSLDYKSQRVIDSYKNMRHLKDFLKLKRMI
jgi:polysaccharide pyruvyl transferase WcaK-like protein